MSFLHQGRDSLHPIVEEYAETLGALHDWSDLGGLEKRG